MSNLAVIEKLELVAVQPKSKFMTALAQSIPQGIGLLAPNLLREALTVLKESQALQQCSEYSIFNAIAEVAQSGLSLSKPLGQVFLVPFKGIATVMYGYRGLCELARRSGEVTDIVGEIRYKNDTFHVHLGTNRELVHIPFDGPISKRGAPLGAYATALMLHGAPMFEYMEAEEIEAIKDSVLKRKKSDKPSPWETSPGEMWRKTPIRRLSKRMPQSPSMIPFVQAAIRDEYRQAGVIDAPTANAVMEVAIDSLGIEPDKVVPELETPPTKPKPERKSQVKESAPDNSPISKAEADDVYTLIVDAKMAVDEALALVGHKGRINTVPRSKLALLIEKIQHRTK